MRTVLTFEDPRGLHEEDGPVGGVISSRLMLPRQLTTNTRLPPRLEDFDDALEVCVTTEENRDVTRRCLATAGETIL